MAREADKAKARQMRDRGCPLQEIGDRFGVSPSTVVRWLDPEEAERQRVAARARKESYRGECVDCGKPTNGSNGPGTAAERCSPCFNEAQAIWTPETVVAAIQRFAERYGRQPNGSDFDPWHARVRGHDWRAERFEADGDYPYLSSVLYVFGSWSAAITAAGFEARPAGKYTRSPNIGPGPRRGAHLEAERPLDQPQGEAAVESEVAA